MSKNETDFMREIQIVVNKWNMHEIPTYEAVGRIKALILEFQNQDKKPVNYDCNCDYCRSKQGIK